jgi:hypothetical protein
MQGIVPIMPCSVVSLFSSHIGTQFYIVALAAT